jgi:hypothetical protein
MLRKFAIALAAGATLGAGVALAPTEASAWGYRCWGCGPAYGWGWRRPYYAGYYGYGWRPRVVAFGW